ncbi:MAG TPA: winged helix-turn-helix domain-containing protein [Pyrinomonadaceae bacterium]|nr:winged helix-turn-helix domain-containing protein [Pyrinomonadaceae bacterium]
MSALDGKTVTSYLFDDIVVSCSDFRVVKGGEQRALSPRAFDVLRYLIEHRGRVVEKAELIEQLWEQRFVTDNALSRVVADVRRALGDSVSSPRYIATVPKRGYRFVATVIEESRSGPAAANELGEIRKAGDSSPASSAVLMRDAPLGLKRRRPAILFMVLFVIAAALAVFLRLPPRSVSVAPAEDTDVSRRSDQTPERVDTAAADPLRSQQPESRLTNIVKAPVQNELTSLTNPDWKLHSQPAPPGLKDANKVEAYQLYLKGHHLLDTLDPAKIQESIEPFRQAIDLCPDYALVYVGLADYYLHTSAKVGNRPRESILMAKAAARKALELDATLAEAHAMMGLVLDLCDWNPAAAEKEIRWALKLDPTPEPVQYALAIHLGLKGRWEESLAASRRALALDPDNARINLNMGWILYSSRHYEEAVAHFQKMLAAGIYVAGSYSWLSQIFTAQGRYEQAMEMDLKFRSLSGAASKSAIESFRSAYAVAGWKGYLQKVAEERKDLAERKYVEPYVTAVIYALLGEREQAFQALEKAYLDRSMFMTRLPRDPAFDGLRSDPRFQDLLRRSGLVVGPSAYGAE